MNLHLYQYNNYYNRTVKPLLSLYDMEEYEIYAEYQVNFNPNDGITTNHIMGGLSQYSGNADYCIVEENNEAVSRWFILENKRTRGGQYQVTLKRDTVAEYQEQVLSAPCFVEKGWVPDTDPAIFNTENMTFNQIKKSEKLLKDNTQVPWLVGYYHKGKTLQASIPASEADADITVSGIANWEYNKFREVQRSIRGFSLLMNFNTSRAATTSHITVDGIGEELGRTPQIVYNEIDTSFANYHYSIILDKGGVPSSTYLELLNQINTKNTRIGTLGRTMFSQDNYVTKSEWDACKAHAGETIFDSATGKLYRIQLKLPDFEYGLREQKTVELTSSLGYELYDIYSKVQGISGSKPTSNSSAANFVLGISSVETYQIVLTEIDTKAYTCTINPAAAAQTSRSPYNIFAMPYGDFTVGIPNNNGFKTMNADMNLRLCMELIKQYSGANGELIDVQLLPYCPVAEIRNKLESGTKPILLLDNINENLWTPINDPDNNPIGCVFYCPDSSHQIVLNEKITVDNIKTSNETEFCRLVSPNWNGMFEFSPAKNYGVELFIVDYELKPFQPYIHIAPAWNSAGLYGKRDNDAIGLICGGDFGLTMVSDAWATYERQNKNYKEIFDRQIQNLEVQNKYGLISDVVGASVGTLSGAATAGAMGMMLGGGAGLGIGLGAGGIASAAGGIADVAINQALRKETMDYTKDLFGYQMGNIKALPQSLTRVNSLNPNNNIFPFIEYYSCTDKEKAALQDKIIYNGMSIGRIGQLKDYLNPTAEYTYVKGQLILLESLGEDSHMADDIAEEIYKGVRI